MLRQLNVDRPRLKPLGWERVSSRKELLEFGGDDLNCGEAWSQIETARQYHSARQYDAAKRFYERAINLLASRGRRRLSTPENLQTGHSENTTESEQLITATASARIPVKAGANALENHGPRLTGLGVSSSPIRDFLVNCFVADYVADRLPIDISGWRTLMDIVGSLKIPRSQVYKDNKSGRSFGRPLDDLTRAGVVEYRVFPNQRGRGGRIVRVRVRFDNSLVRELIDKRAQATVASS